jgi:hypothetical protein
VKLFGLEAYDLVVKDFVMLGLSFYLWNPNDEQIIIPVLDW